jgi:diaminopimelate decarboxylase
MLFPDTYEVNAAGHMSIGGCDLLDLAHEHGTPLYVYCETTMRRRIAEIRDTLGDAYPGESLVLYAGKAFLTVQVAKLVATEGAGLDVVSGGELRVAERAGFPMERVFFPGNNKSADEVDDAIRLQVGGLVVDSPQEIEMLQARSGATVRAVLRVSPGIQPDTHSFISTGQLDSKFGFPVETGQALDAMRRLLALDGVDLLGVHAHIGSQIYELDSYRAAAERVLNFLAQVRDELGFRARDLSLGGGLGIAYTREDKPPRLADFARSVADAVANGCERHALELPRLLLEPGRSIAGPAGVALYTVGAIKEIPGVRTYVAVDGGMGDNLRPKLYGARYEAFKVNAPEAAAKTVVTIAGRYCESTDILINDARMPVLKPGDVICIPASGAYHYAMASNYNYNLRPAVVMVHDGTSRLIRRRETYEDLLVTEP